jgi:DNA primase
MRNFVDFAEVKERVSFAEALSCLGLELKGSGNQWRGPCPACKSGGDRALVVTEGRGFFCFSLKKGGDQIALAAHILDVPAKDAARTLAQHAGLLPGAAPRTGPKTVPESEGAEGSKLSPLSYLEPEHDAVLALGFDPEVAKTLGIGYAPRGVCRGSIAVPIRNERGALLGYLGVQDLTYLPPDFQTNVVPLKRPA